MPVSWFEIALLVAGNFSDNAARRLNKALVDVDDDDVLLTMTIITYFVVLQRWASIPLQIVLPVRRSVYIASDFSVLEVEWLSDSTLASWKSTVP